MYFELLRKITDGAFVLGGPGQQSSPAYPPEEAPLPLGFGLKQERELVRTFGDTTTAIAKCTKKVSSPVKVRAFPDARCS